MAHAAGQQYGKGKAMTKEELYNAADCGGMLDPDCCMSLLQEYQRLVIWGAGNLGTILGSELKRRNLPVSCYWDARFESVLECNGLPVREPMAENTGAGTLVVFCITNAFVIPKLEKMMEEKNIAYIRGTAVYQSFLCPVSMQNPVLKECYSRKECNIATCRRMEQVMYLSSCMGSKIFYKTVDVYVTQKCSLGCKYCYIYTNSYPDHKKIHFDTRQILENIDSICETASFITRMVPFGGEPFLHPDIGKIVAWMAQKKNIGAIDIISNGIFRQPAEVLAELKYDRVRIDISNYNMMLPQELVSIREENIQKMQELGLNVIIHNETPQWRKPGTFDSCGLSCAQLEQKKAGCANFESSGNEIITTTAVVKNGKLFPCQHCDTAYQLGITPQTEDYLDLSLDLGAEERIRRIKELIRRKYYDACQYCNPSIELVEFAGEQGMDQRYEVVSG